ncbi:MerR family transcriptional regulator [Sphingomonas profundi]|uniref:MerR family transcriptional regulator n=1 Tax=Alterirhizorhabdus profundi TaxID=2681549 RepID=UPI0018D1279A|nr:MerR family transcriptional regulator [Sphingomonas profundi]
MTKADTAFRTISEVASETGVAQHILRYWETRFPQLRPLQRAGNRRYYRPADIDLVRRIDTLLNRQGYTIKGVQALLARDAPEPAPPPPAPRPELLAELRAIRDAMADALATDGTPARD